MIKYIVSLASSLALLALAMPASAQDDRVNALEHLAEDQNASALYHLGMMYLTGTSVDRDQERAVKYFQESARLGDPLAAYKLGCFFDGQYNLFEVDFDRALEWKLIAAEAGYALAQQDVAKLYLNRGEYDLALQWLERAAQQGTKSSLLAYASVHNGHLGVEKDPVIAFAYFQLFLRDSAPSDAQKQWLNEFASGMTKAQRAEARRILRDYKPEPSPLTIEAMSGLDAADRLIRQN